MGIPEYQSFMLPVLNGLAGRAPGRVAALAALAADALNLPEAAHREVLAWNHQPVLEARVEQAARDLDAAGLVRRDRDSIVLTDRGASVLEEGPETVDKRFLLRFEEFAASERERLSRRGA